jgi:hypothetical protein
VISKIKPNPATRFKNRVDLDKTFKDSFLDRLENLSNFSKFDVGSPNMAPLKKQRTNVSRVRRSDDNALRIMNQRIALRNSAPFNQLPKLNGNSSNRHQSRFSKKPSPIVPRRSITPGLNLNMAQEAKLNQLENALDMSLNMPGVIFEESDEEVAKSPKNANIGKNKYKSSRNFGEMAKKAKKDFDDMDIDDVSIMGISEIGPKMKSSKEFVTPKNNKKNEPKSMSNLAGEKTPKSGTSVVNMINNTAEGIKSKQKLSLDLLKKKKKKQKRLEVLIEKNNVDQAEQPNCLICLDNIPDSIFHPCGHGGFCFECAKNIIDTNALCHYCRKVKFC